MASFDDPFEILGLPARMGLTDGEIEQAYLASIARTHPDVGALDPNVGETDGGDASALLNHARRVLLDAEARANALHARLGGPSAEVDRSLPDGFLMEILEVRERVESGETKQIEAVHHWARDQRATHIDRTSALLTDPSPENLALARTELNAWRYIERLLEQTSHNAEGKRGAGGVGGRGGMGA